MGAGPRPHRRVLLLLSLLLFSAMAAAAPALVIDDAFQRADLTLHLDMLADTNGQLTLAHVVTPPYGARFTPVRPGDLDITSGRGYLWLRFALSNPSQEPRIALLQLLPRDLAGVQLFRRNTLLPLPPLQLDMLVRNYNTFRILVPAQTQELFYLRLQTTGLLSTHMLLSTPESYLRDQSRLATLRGAAWGALMLLIAGMVVAALRYRDPAYVWLAATATLLQLPQVLDPANAPWRPQLVSSALLLGIACNLALTLQINALPRHSRYWRLLLIGAVIGAVAMVPLQWLAQTTSLVLPLAVHAIALLLIAAAGLHAFVIHYRPPLLGYALVHITVLLLGAANLLVQRVDASLLDHATPLMLALNLQFLLLLALLVVRSHGHRQVTEAQRRVIAVAEAESRSRTEVIAEVGHRIRTPASGVLGMLEMLQDTPLSATQRDYLATIQRAGNELLNVVADLGDASRLGAPGGGLEQARLDLSALITECVDGFRSLANSQQLELITDLAPELPPLVSGDPTRLRQILLQLLHHAIAACEGGEVVLHAAPISARHWLRFRLQARGRAPRDGGGRRPSTPGANLRPAIARQLVEMLGGRITLVEPAPGQLDAEFDLPLPATELLATSSGNDSPLHNRQMLLIDDNATFCEVLQRQASHWGMTVHSALSASEGVAWLRNQATLGVPVDVVLVDADLPEMIEDEWLERLHAIANQPVLILLASRPPAESERLQRLGVRRVLLKPISHTSLRLTLEEELNYREQRQPARIPAQERAPLRCLAAEDNVINARVLVGMLEKLGVETTLVGNGQQAVEACQRHDYDIVLMDCDMPIMDGWEAARRIREVHGNRGLPALPIIALTANTVEELGERARNPVMDAHLVKPINLRELRALLERWTGREVIPPPRYHSSR